MPISHAQQPTGNDRLSCTLDLDQLSFAQSRSAIDKSFC